ncbi:MAG: 30S ribosomal protein S24 [Thermoprotei archaeon ex4572_64]|nr:MAG: 30S ribosomal protein S24 [Thermoprotei archaeon ex4572_64]
MEIPGIPEDVEIGKVTYRIVDDRKNPLLKRRELKIEIWHVGVSTPTRLDVRKYVASTLGVDENLVFVRKILTGFGLGKSVAEVHVYESIEQAKIIEPLYIHLRNMPREEAKKIMEELRRKSKEKKKR